MPTHYRGSQHEVRALNAYIKLMRAADSITARLDGVMAGAGLTIGQFGVLEALLHLGPLCQRDLGRKLLRSNGNVTVVLNNLGRRGLVRRTRRHDDRRFITVTLTAKGRRLIGGIFPGHVARVVRELRVLSPDEQDALGSLCRRVGLGVAHDTPAVNGTRHAASRRLTYMGASKGPQAPDAQQRDRPQTAIEERHGFAGALPSVGGLGDPSRSPSRSIALPNVGGRGDPSRSPSRSIALPSVGGRGDPSRSPSRGSRERRLG